MHFLREIVYAKENTIFLQLSASAKENQGIESFEKNRPTIFHSFLMPNLKKEREVNLRYGKISVKPKLNAISRNILKFTQKTQSSLSRNLLIGKVFIN